jgi:hypothetical protein
MLDRLTRPWILRPSRLEEVENVLCARCRPEREEMVILVGEGAATPDRDEAWVSDLREDHWPEPLTPASTQRSEIGARGLEADSVSRSSLFKVLH